VIVDDVLVNFDPERAARAAEAFALLAQTHQVLVFTCHPTTVAQVLAAAPVAALSIWREEKHCSRYVRGGQPNDG
jgi:uncharacterized protein YhaN